MNSVSVLILAAVCFGPSVHDGDTWRDATCTKRRLWGADVVELDQTCDGEPCGLWARGALAEILAKGEVVCEDRGASYDRVVSRCFVNGMDVSRQMVRLGWAVDVLQFSGGEYADTELEARRAKRGMWGYKEVVTPWAWRTTHGRRSSRQ